MDDRFEHLMQQENRNLRALARRRRHRRAAEEAAKRKQEYEISLEAFIAQQRQKWRQTAQQHQRVIKARSAQYVHLTPEQIQNEIRESWSDAERAKRSGYSPPPVSIPEWPYEPRHHGYAPYDDSQIQDSEYWQHALIPE